MNAAEFSRPERIDMIGPNPRSVTVEATPAEREALARRFGLVSLDMLTAVFAVSRDAGGIIAEGRVTARLAQPCSVTAEPVPAELDEPVRLRFVAETDAADELELSAEDLDVLTYEGGAIDLGEAAAETMALALDPFPRAPGAGDALRAAGVLGEDDVGPFSALAGLREKLAK